MELTLTRLSIRWKIFMWCFGLALAIVGFNLWYATGLVRKSAGRSLQELQSFYNRYQGFQASSSRFLTAAVDIWADSRDVRQAFAKDDAVAERQIMLEAQTALTQTVRAAFVIFSDRRGAIQTYGALDETSARAMRAVADLRAGMSVRDTILEHDGHAFLIAGEPIMVNGAQVGGIMVGIRLEQVFAEFKHQTDEDPARQVELALVHNLRSTAASEPTELWDTIAHATRPEARETVEEGGEKVQVLVLPRGEHNFFGAQVNGYDGASQGLLGTLYVMRNRLERTRHIDNLIRDTSAMALFALAGAALVAFMISIIVTRPISQFIAATEDLAHGGGDLTKRLQTRPRDGAEVHQLAQNLNQLFAKLETLASEVQGASLQVGTSSAEISAASKQMLGGAKDQASRIEESTAAVTELSSSIQTVAENAIQATKVTQQSGESLAASIRQLGEVAHIIEDTAAKIRELGQSGKRIGTIVEVIRQISEQTSLLALNASIEAAHAGEQGRGFAVVADEVSSLARRVGQSAKDIEGLIGTIAEQTAQTVTSMQTATQVFGEHVRRSSEMQENLHQIIAVTQDTARSVQEQATVSDEIARNMDAVQKITHEVLGSSEEAVVQGEQLHALALKLEELVHGFRLDSDGTTRPTTTAQPPALPQRSSERRRTARS